MTGHKMEISLASSYMYKTKPKFITTTELNPNILTSVVDKSHINIHMKLYLKLTTASCYPGKHDIGK